MELFSGGAIAYRDHANLDLGTVFTGQDLLNIFFADLNLVGCQGSQGQHRPDDLAGVAIRSKVAILFECLQEQLRCQAIRAGHAGDLLIDLLIGDRNAFGTARLNDQMLVEKVVEHDDAIASHALLSQSFARDRLSADGRHDLGQLRHGVIVFLSSLCGGGRSGGRWICHCAHLIRDQRSTAARCCEQ